MARRPPRGADQYFDRELVLLLNGLFESAARARVEGKRLFPPGRNNRLRPGAVRELFGIGENDYSCWKFQTWPGAAKDRPLTFAELLCATFEPEGPSPAHDPELAKKVRVHWQTHCKEELAEALDRLRAHRSELEARDARRPFGGQARDPQGVPMDLRPPPRPDAIRRPGPLAKVARLAEEYFAVVIEGRPRSGKRDLASAFALQQGQGARLLWFRLFPTSALADLFVRLAAIEQPLNAQPADTGAALVDWLVTTDTVLVLDGLDYANHQSFAPLLRLARGLPGPARLLATSSVRTGGANSFDIPPLTVDEAHEVLARLAAPSDPQEVGAICSAAPIPASALWRAASLFGRVDRETLAAVMEERHADLVRGAPELLRGAVEILQMLEADFDREVLELILAELRVDTPALEVLATLEALLLITPSSAGTWRSETRRSEFAPISMPPARFSSVIATLAEHYAAGVDPTKKDLSTAETADLYAASRLLQMANMDPRRRLRLRRRFSAPMERQGAFRKLADLYQHEYDAGEAVDDWLGYRLARAQFVLGRYDAALTVLRSEIGRSLLRREGRDETLHLSLLRLLSELLIEVDEPLLALKVVDRAIAAVRVQDLQSTACMQAVSILSWALVRHGMPQACVDVNRELLDKRFEGLAPPFSRQISNVRIGVALRALGDLEASAVVLDEARDYFAPLDARAYAWSTLNLAVTYDEAGRYEAAAGALKAALETNATHDLFGGDLQGTYDRFLSRAEDYSDLLPALGGEVQRISAREAVRRGLVERLRAERLVGHILIDLGASVSELYAFSLESYAIFSARTPFPIASDFNRSLVRQHRRGNAEDIVDRVFAAKGVDEVFQSHIHNRLIVDTCKDHHFLAKKYILPHLDVIGRQSDSIMFLYARCLETIGQTEAALGLLTQVRNQADFSFFNISANCLAKTAPLEALGLNDQAFAAARSRQQRAQVLNNKAALVLEHGLRQRFDEAKAWCEEAIRLAEKPKFFWPRNLLLRLELETSELQDVETLLDAHRDRFRTPLRALREIVIEVGRRRIRERGLTHLEAAESSALQARAVRPKLSRG